jgi:hypothetical protein
VSYAKFVSIMETMTDECNSFSGDEEYIYDVCMYVYDIYIYIYIYIYMYIYIYTRYGFRYLNGI